MSILGHIAEAIVIIGQHIGRCIGFELFPRKLIVGPPKQFAAFCGFMMSGIATSMFFCSLYTLDKMSDFRFLFLQYCCLLIAL